MPDSTTVYFARRIITMDPGRPEATAVAVSGGRITAVGALEDLRGTGEVDDTFAEAVLCPGLIDQHLHPLLGATTLMTEVIAVEDWVLPDRTFPAARSPEEYRQRLLAAEQALTDPDEWLFSWGYHALWHGPLDRAALDTVSQTRPVVVWQRSCHEFFLNTAAIGKLGLTAEQMAGHGAASDMVDFAAGHWWESGTNLLLGGLAPLLMSPQRITAGLHQMVGYLHANGVTAINEPGIMWAIEPWDLYQQILGADETPFLSTFLVDARSQADAGMDPADAVADAEAQVATASPGKVRLLPKQVKLFADGAIISQLMQMRDPYLDDAGHPDLCHHGEWMMQPDAFRAFARVYWNADWQLHIHVNGDAGLDLVLDTIEDCMAAHPRTDHRTVIVHFANSGEEQIDRIARLGCLVSANSYYPVGFADKYAAHGLGAQRADSMVRAASVLRRGIPLSLHSDLPMGPAAPLALASFAVNRRTPSGRVVAPEQRISIHDALRAVTIEAAYSWRMEHELGSIAVGKAATFTVLAEDPYGVDPGRLGDIAILGTVHEGRWFAAHAVRSLTGTLGFERRDAVAIVTINDAPYNRMTFAFMDALETLVGEIAADDGIRAVVITGAGDQNFSVGMNLKELVGALGDTHRVDEILDQRLRVLSAIEDMDKPWIATLFGNCLGGGLELPLACHFRLAAQEGAKIGLPELHLGSVPAWGGSARLVRCIGRDRAIDMILRARTVSGPEALNLGLVTEVWPNAELKQRAADLADELAAQPRVAMAAMLRCLVGSAEKTLQQSLSDERAAFHATLGSPDMVEGLTAFMEKRTPVFNRTQQE